MDLTVQRRRLPPRPLSSSVGGAHGDQAEHEPSLEIGASGGDHGEGHASDDEGRQFKRDRRAPHGVQDGPGMDVAAGRRSSRRHADQGSASATQLSIDRQKVRDIGGDLAGFVRSRASVSGPSAGGLSLGARHVSHANLDRQFRLLSMAAQLASFVQNYVFEGLSQKHARVVRPTPIPGSGSASAIRT